MVPSDQKLASIGSHPLVLLSAFAGFGKTTLLSTWARQNPHHVAWLSLEEEDNDLSHFWPSVLTALRPRFSLAGEMAEELASPAPPSELRLLLTTLINELATLGEEVVLILDDYQVIGEAPIHASLRLNR